MKRGPEFALERKKLEHDLTKEMLANGAWKTATFKEYTLVLELGTSQRWSHYSPVVESEKGVRDFLTARV